MSEIDDKRSQVSSKESEKAALESENANYEAILERLRAAKTIVNQSDNDFRDYRSDMNNDYKKYDDTWVGDQFNAYKTMEETDLQDTDYKNYIDNGVNVCLDDLCDKITYYENKIYENNGLIGALQSAINSLCNEIEKLLNNL